MIQDVKIKLLQDIMAPHGGVQHMLRADDEFFSGFGEIYFSIVNPGVIRGWHMQTEQTNALSCIKGDILLVLYDGREGSPTFGKFQEVRFGDGNRKLVLVPPGVIYGWKNVSDQQSMLANCANRVHDPAKSVKIDLEKIPYW